MTHPNMKTSDPTVVPHHTDSLTINPPACYILVRTSSDRSKLHHSPPFTAILHLAALHVLGESGLIRSSTRLDREAPKASHVGRSTNEGEMATQCKISSASFSYFLSLSLCPSLPPSFSIYEKCLYGVFFQRLHFCCDQRKRQKPKGNGIFKASKSRL